jgi:cell division protein FtsB
MKRSRTEPRVKRDSARQALALVALVAMGAFAVAGPSGIMAWGENQRLLEQRRVDIVRLGAERDALKNKVNLLDPNHPNSDFVAELARERLNVMDRDDKVMVIH